MQSNISSSSFTSILTVSVLLLFVALTAVSLVALYSRVGSQHKRSPEQDLEKHVRDLQREATKIGRRLSRSSSSFRAMSVLLATIEILGGAYFAITGSNPTLAQHDSSGVTPVSLLGFAIIVVTAIQNRVHPYAKGVELRFRAWRIGHMVDRSELASYDGLDMHSIARALVEEIAQATKPFTDKPEDHRGNSDPDPFSHAEPGQGLKFRETRGKPPASPLAP